MNNSEEHDHMGVEVMDPSRHHGSFNWSIGGDLPRGRAVNMHFRTLVRLWNVHNLGAPGNLDIYEIWSFWYHRDVPNLCIFMWYLMMFEISIYDIYHIYVRWVRYFKLWSKARCRNTLVPYKEATSQQSEMLKAAEMGGATPKLWKPRGVSYCVEMPKIVKIRQTGINSSWKLAMINGTPYIHSWGCLFILGWSDVSIQLWNSNLVSS